jgi:hypothetical protein
VVNGLDETRLKTKQPFRILIRLIGLPALLLLLPARWEAMPMIRQSDNITWSEPVNLSNTPASSMHPAIVSDAYGYVHVFWSEDVGGEPVQPEDGDSGLAGNTILYMRWDGVSWTQPIDVLFVPDESVAEFIAVDVDAENRIHAVWTGQSNFYYSSAPSWRAESGHAWSKPMIVATNSAPTQWESDIVVDVSGNLHIVYATRGDEPGIYHIRSRDGGVTWESATKISQPFDRLETSFSNVKVIADAAGRVHAVWQTILEQGFGYAVYYARSTDQGKSWDSPVRLGQQDPGDFETSWPYIMDVGTSGLHLIYVDGPSSIGRSHRISVDGGATWSEPHSIITEMEGINGYVIPVLDASGQMHLVMDMRTRAEQVVGIYYARWLGESWSPVLPVDVSSQSASEAHYPAVTIRLGNELHVVWTQLSSREIWHAYGAIPFTNQIPPLLVLSHQALTPTPSPQPTTALVLKMLTPLPEPLSQTEDLGNPIAPSSVPVSPIMLSVGTSLLLVAGVVAWKRVHSR